MHNQIAPIQSFEANGKRYTLTHSSRSDAAFDSLRDGIDYFEREMILSKVSHLEESDVPPAFKSNASLALQEQFINCNSRQWTVAELLRFGQSHQGLPYLLVVASPEIKSFEEAREVVASMDAKELVNIVEKAMIAGGILKEKNLSGPNDPKAGATAGQSSQMDSNSTAS